MFRYSFEKVKIVDDQMFVGKKIIRENDVAIIRNVFGDLKFVKIKKSKLENGMEVYLLN